uniref:Uncharacterized protein n=1 Tax=Macaca fascicularis TaxID=9541 RepID=A0A7N9CD97_MACFA
CWRLDLHLLCNPNLFSCLPICLVLKNNSRVRVHNLQVCYICIHVPCWCAAPINLSFTINSKFTSV